MGLLSRLWDALGQLAALVFPALGHARDAAASPAFRWAVRILLVAAYLVGLWLLQRFLRLETILPRAPTQTLREFWLPLLGLLFLILGVLGWWLWKLLARGDEGAEFPDIEAAWHEAVAALEQAGVNLADVPVFLVLGRPAAPEQHLFDAADLRFLVRQAPVRADAPLHVYAFRDGRYDSVFVTCAGASLLGRLADLLAGGPGPEEASPPPAWSAPLTSEQLAQTLQPQGETLGIANLLVQAQREGRGPEQLTEEERQQLRRLERRTRPSLVKNAAEVGRATARLKYLCRLIARERRPVCPVNGLVVLVPFAATDADEDALQTAAVCQQDLAAARLALQLHCPVLALTCDLETAPGFREFLERFPKEQLKQRLGQRFPLLPDIEKGAATAYVERGGQWICQALFPTWIHRFLQVEGSDPAKGPEAQRANTQLVKLMGALWERSRRLGVILGRGVAVERDGPALYGGCYVAATGADSAREQAFVAGFFRKVIENQNFVAWTDEALRQDADARRWTRVGYAGIAVGTAVLAVLAWRFWPFASGR